MPKISRGVLVGVVFLFLGAVLLPVSVVGGSIVGPGGCSIGGVSGISPSTTSVNSGSPITFSGKIQSGCNYVGSIVDIWTSFSNGLLNSPAGGTLNQVTVQSANTWVFSTTAPNSAGTWYIAAQIANCPPPPVTGALAAQCSYATTQVAVNYAAPKTSVVQFQYSGQGVGSYVSGVLVTVDQNNQQVGIATSNSQGIATFNLVPGTYQVYSLPTSGAALQADSRTIVVSSAPIFQSITLSAVPIQAVHYTEFIQLRINNTGAWLGISGASVTVTNGSQTIFTGTTDNTGSVQVTGLNNGTYGFSYTTPTGLTGSGTFQEKGYAYGNCCPVLVLSFPVLVKGPSNTQTTTTTNNVAPTFSNVQASTAFLGFALMIVGIVFIYRFRRA